LGLGDGSFNDWPDGFSSFPFKNVGIALFGDLRHGIDPLAVFLDSDQVGIGWKVSIPNIVVNRLKMPNPLACSSIKR